LDECFSIDSEAVQNSFYKFESSAKIIPKIPKRCENHHKDSKTKKVRFLITFVRFGKIRVYGTN